MSLLNLYASKPSTHQELLSVWSIYLTDLYMIEWLWVMVFNATFNNFSVIEWSKINERLHDTNFVLKKIQQTSNFN